MRLNKIIMLIALLLAGCSDVEYPIERTVTEIRTNCTKDTVLQRSDFILTCIENANPHSDEEPEDWIGKCQEIAEETMCQAMSVIILQTRNCSQCYWTDAKIEINPSHEAQP